MNVISVIFHRLVATVVFFTIVVVVYTVADSVKQDPVVVERVVVVTTTPAARPTLAVTPTPKVGYNRTGEGLSKPSLEEWLDAQLEE